MITEEESWECINYFFENEMKLQRELEEIAKLSEEIFDKNNYGDKIKIELRRVDKKTKED